MILGCDTKALNAMNNLGLWTTRTTPGYELKALDVMKSSRVAVDMKDSKS